MITRLSFLLLFLHCGLPLFEAQAFDHTHRLLTSVLQSNVKDGRVNYQSLKENPSELDKYLTQLGAVTQQEINSFSHNEKLAFYINLYNATTLQFVRNNYPVSSIKKLGGFFSSAWKQNVVALHGKKVTLDHIEHDIIRAKFKEPRVHFALVCAAKGCPPLRNESYVAARINEQLNDQGTTFLSNTQKNYFDQEKKTLYVSKIFSWFAEDFGGSNSEVIDFVVRFMPEETAKKVRSVNPISLSYTSYDWSLNGQ